VTIQGQSFRRHDRALAGTRRLATTTETSARMGRIRQRGTAPELRVRRFLTKIGWHYRTRNRTLPGSPDLANRSKNWAIFVHGCFWHGHEDCSKATVPKRNRSFWIAKFTANRTRDARARAQLKDMGFAVATIWECQTCSDTSIRSALEPVLKPEP
jgi:DNA mismatch endonuclease, patch repair protein